MREGVLQRMVRLALVEADFGAALHASAEDPFDDEQRALDPPDLAWGCG